MLGCIKRGFCADEAAERSRGGETAVECIFSCFRERVGESEGKSWMILQCVD